MRIRDWSSDVCSSDLTSFGEAGRDSWADLGRKLIENAPAMFQRGAGGGLQAAAEMAPPPPIGIDPNDPQWADRKSVGEGKSVSVRVDLGGRRIIKKKKDVTSEETSKITRLQTN